MAVVSNAASAASPWTGIEADSRARVTPGRETTTSRQACAAGRPGHSGAARSTEAACSSCPPRNGAEVKAPQLRPAAAARHPRPSKAACSSSSASTRLTVSCTVCNWCARLPAASASAGPSDGLWCRPGPRPVPGSRRPQRPARRPRPGRCPYAAGDGTVASRPPGVIVTADRTNPSPRPLHTARVPSGAKPGGRQVAPYDATALPVAVPGGELRQYGRHRAVPGGLGAVDEQAP